MRVDHLTPCRVTGAPLRRVSSRIGVDMAALLHTDRRADPGDRLAERGWTVRRDGAADVAAGRGRTFDPLTARLDGRSSFVTATR